MTSDIDWLFVSYDQSGSQGNLCDSWADDGIPDGASGGGERRQKLSTSKIRAMPAEYPFQANLGLPQNTINFDLTHKRGNYIYFYVLIVCHECFWRILIFFYWILKLITISIVCGTFNFIDPFMLFC